MKGLYIDLDVYTTHVYRECSEVASGTLATLTNARDFTTLDVYRECWLSWVRRALRLGFLDGSETWKSAWNCYVSARAIHIHANQKET